MMKRSSAFRWIAVTCILLIVPLVTFIPLIVFPVTFIPLIAPPVTFIPLIGPSGTAPPPGAPRKYRYSHCGNGRGAHLDKHSAIHILTSPFSFSLRRRIRPYAHTVYHCHKIARTNLPYWGRILAHPLGQCRCPLGLHRLCPSQQTAARPEALIGHCTHTHAHTAGIGGSAN